MIQLINRRIDAIEITNKLYQMCKFTPIILARLTPTLSGDLFEDLRPVLKNRLCGKL